MAEDDADDVELREVQIAKLRKSKRSIVARLTDAIEATGLEDGSFRFDPDSIDELGMLTAVGIDERVDGRSNPLARSIHHEGVDVKSLKMPPKVLDALEIDPEEVDWDNPPEFRVWAGDGVLALEPMENRTVPIRRGEQDDDSDSDGDQNGA